jgi:hypothetical protein
MVSLAASGRIRPGQDDLHDSAFWYPRVPEAGFSARETAMTSYDPICWTMFGGPAGLYLASLTGISVTADASALKAIEFHYSNSEHVPLECRKVGRCTPSDYAETKHFEIDGPGGQVH